MQNNYEVIAIVGEGAYGIVYKCRNKETGEYVAVKKFKETDDEIVKKTMRRELKVLKILKHDNIVEFKEAFKKKGNLFLVFEFVEKNLLELLEESPNGLDHQLIKLLMYQLCKAVKYLHDQNIIHRDVKPENLLIKDNKILKLCDFGFARKIVKQENLTDYVATRWYRSPELLITGGVYGPEVDYWAIGCIMGELADGNPLFPGENETDQLHCIQKILGNLPEDQVEMFYSNPLFNGKALLNVEKPETLELRYTGKLPKQAIHFMKQLLHLDPKKRLCGDKVFEHPYFSCFANDNHSRTISQPPQSTRDKKVIVNNTNNNNNNVNTMNNNKITISPLDTIVTSQNNNTNTNLLTNQLVQSNNNNNNQQNGYYTPKSINTTNINIINYNNYSNNPTLTVPSTKRDQNANTIESVHNSSKDINYSSAYTSPNVPVVTSSPHHTCNLKIKKKNSNNMIMAQTMANKFPGTYKSNIIFKNQKPTTQRQSYDYLKDKEIPPPLTTTSVTFTTWNKNNSPNKNNNTNPNYNDYPIGFKTFYKNNKNDKYNYPINTNYTSTNGNTNNNNNYYYKGDNPIIEEEDEYKTSVKQSNNQKNIFQNALKYEQQYSPSREKNKYTMYNYVDKKKTMTYFHNPKNKSNSPAMKNYNKSNNHYKNTNYNFHLPSLGRNVNYNNGNNNSNNNATNFNYYLNIKNFQKMIMK